MKLLRFFLLLGVCLIAYLGQFLLTTDLPQDSPLLSTLRQLPGLAYLLALPRAQAVNWGGGLLVAGGLLFGLVAAAWPRPSDSPTTPQSPPSAGSNPRPLPGLLLLALALLLAFANGAWIASGRAESGWTLGIWICGLLAALAGGWFLARDSQSNPAQPAAPSLARPEAGWPSLLLLLAGLLAFSLWRLADLPLEVDGDTASHGLQALELLSGRDSRLFAPGWANIPLLAFVPAALGMLFVDNVVVGMRLAGVYAGLLTVLGTWLLGCEILRRPPRFGPAGEVIDDDGRWGALMAAAAVAGAVALLHYSRIPEYLEPVGWGALGLWAFLRGLRTRDPLALAASGLLVGVAGGFYFSGRIFLPVVLAWSLGVLLLRREWWQVRGVGSGWQGLGVWVVAYGAALSPIMGYWLRSPVAFLERTQEVSIFNPPAFQHLSAVFGAENYPEIFLASLRVTLLTFNLTPDKSSHFGFEGPMLNPLIAPVLALGLGFGLIYVWRLPGWLLLSWFGGVLLAGGALTIDAPTWSRMLPILPAVGLLVALGLDRLRVSLVESGGHWLEQITLVAAVGLLLVAGLRSGVDYVDYMGYEADQYSLVGRAAAQLPLDRPIWVYVGDAPDNARWQDRVPHLLSGQPYNGRPAGDLYPGQWESLLTPGSSLLLHRDDVAVLAQVRARFPGGRLEIFRNKEARPMLFVYTLAE